MAGNRQPFVKKSPGNILFAAVFAVLLFTLPSCGSRLEVPEHLTVFRYNEDLNITSLDPVYARNQANIWGVAQLYNGLVELDDSLFVRPAIARRWEVSDDGKEYTFYLRDDVYFHDDACFPGGRGRRAVASDFVYSFSRLVDTRLNAPGAWVMNPVNRKADGSLDIHAVNDTTLVIRLSHAFPPFPGLLTMQYCAVVPEEAINKYGQDFRRNPVGTGPFQFAYWKEGVKLVYRRNERYFEWDGGRQLPFLDAVSISFISDRHTAFLEFVKGNLDLLTRIDPSYKDELITPLGELQGRYQDRLTMITMPFLNSEYLGFFLGESVRHTEDWPLHDKRVRQAINYGFDRQRMLTFLRNNLGTPAHAGFVPVGMPGFTENSGGYRYDPDRAAQLLAEAGYPGGTGLPAITLHTTQAYQDIAQYLQFELSHLGMNIAIDVIPPATLREMMAGGQAPFFRGSWIADYPDAENYLALFYSQNKTPAGPNYTHFSDPYFDALYEQSLAETNDSLRYRLYHKMDGIIIDQAPKVFLFYDRSARFVHNNVSNMTNNPLNHLVLKRVEINRE
ncbi:MAG: ABC transporter substrate-binding protein [Bacteroidales bacterium]|nr:ABC transporter substrate-binding protein [Bacteroidales bacterium]